MVEIFVKRNPRGSKTPVISGCSETQTLVIEHNNTVNSSVSNSSKFSESEPLELQDVIKTVKRYARQTYALGVAKSVRELQVSIISLDNLNQRLNSVELSQITDTMKSKFQELESLFKTNYSL